MMKYSNKPCVPVTRYLILYFNVINIIVIKLLHTASSRWGIVLMIKWCHFHEDINKGTE